MKTYLIMLLVLLMFSCSKKRENKEIILEVLLTSNIDSSNSYKNTTTQKKDTMILDLVDVPYSDTLDDATLQKWKNGVRKNGDEYYYYKLLLYSGYHPSLDEEMIGLTQIMINKSKDKDIFMLSYYDYVENSKSANKKRLMAKAIGYLKILAEKEDNIHSVQGRSELAKIYREGLYVQKDTVVANFLDNGGRNLDSMLQVRALKR